MSLVNDLIKPFSLFLSSYFSLAVIDNSLVSFYRSNVTLGGLFGDAKYEKTAKLSRCCSVGQVACYLGVINSCVPFSDVKNG
jgi:hypothetical protein